MNETRSPHSSTAGGDERLLESMLVEYFSRATPMFKNAVEIAKNALTLRAKPEDASKLLGEAVTRECESLNELESQILSTVRSENTTPDSAVKAPSEPQERPLRTDDGAVRMEIRSALLRCGIPPASGHLKECIDAVHAELLPMLTQLRRADTVPVEQGDVSDEILVGTFASYGIGGVVEDGSKETPAPFIRAALATLSAMRVPSKESEEISDGERVDRVLSAIDALPQEWAIKRIFVEAPRIIRKLYLASRTVTTKMLPSEERP